MNEGSAGLAGLAGQIAGKARQLRAAPRKTQARRDPGGPPGLAEVRAASELASLAGSLLQASVQQARAAGRTWQEIGEVLGVSRQAAFQRFGRPADPRTGGNMRSAALRNAGPAAAALLGSGPRR